MMRSLIFSLVLAHASMLSAQVRLNEESALSEMLRRGKKVPAAKALPADSKPFAAIGNRFTNQSIWKIYFDEQKAHANWILFDTNQMPVLLEESLKQAALDFIDRNPVFFGFAASDLVAAKNDRINVSDDLVNLNFSRTYHGIEVRDAVVEFSFKRVNAGFKLREILNRAFGELTLNTQFSQGVSVFDLRAVTGDLDYDVLSQKRQILALGFANAAGIKEFVLTTEFKIRDRSNAEELTLNLREDDRSLVEAYSKKVHSTELQANVYKRTYLETEKFAKPVPFTSVSMNGQTLTTDADGYLPGESFAAAQITLSSPRVRVRNSGAAQPITFNATLNTDAFNVLSPTANDLNAFNAYLAIHEINRFVRRNVKASEANLLNRAINVQINVSGSCNAFYDGNISLFAAGGGCANMGGVNDVIYHEWGHGLDDDTGPSGNIANGAFSDGIGDIVAAYFTNSSNMAPGFFQGQTNGIRQLKNGKRFPQDQGEVHDEGQIIGGAFWDLREALIARHGVIKGAYMAEYFFFRHLLTTDTYTQSYQSVLRLDDNDGNPATPSPNRCLIAKAFKNHGLSNDVDCTDPVQADAVPVDQSLVLGVKSSDANGAILMIAVDKATSVELCRGERSTCLAEGGSLEFDFEGVGEDGKLFFIAKNPTSLQEHGIVTILARDAGGALQGARSLKFATK